MDKIRKNDEVIVLVGKDKGRRGVVQRRVDAEHVIVDGVNVAKKHQRALRATMQAGIIDKDMPLPASNVAILCPTDGPTRIGYRFDDQGKKVRICRKCGGDL